MIIEYRGEKVNKASIDDAIKFITAKIVFSEDKEGIFILRGEYDDIIEFDKKEYNVIVFVRSSFRIFDYPRTSPADISAFIKRGLFR